MLTQEDEASSRQLRRVAFRFYLFNFCSCWITWQEARRFSPSPRDCEIIRRASRASVSDFRASQRERALSLFAHISSSRACAWVCTQRARLYRRALLRKVFQNCAKPCLVWQTRKENVGVAASRIGPPAGVHCSRWRNSKFCIRTNSSLRGRDRYESEFPQNRSRECGTIIF